jgi:shikimate kinase
MQVNFADNVFLTGFMGCGKTTLGSKLAKALRWTFIDLDQYIEKKEKITIQSIFENFGEKAFRKIEQTCLNELLDKEKNTVISLGGGTVCFEDNLERIKKSGCLIFIEMPAISLAQRLENSKVKRPLLKNKKGEELIKFINDKLAERSKFYEQADIKVSGINLTPHRLEHALSEHWK